MSKTKAAACLGELEAYRWPQPFKLQLNKYRKIQVASREVTTCHATEVAFAKLPLFFAAICVTSEKKLFAHCDKRRTAKKKSIPQQVTLPPLARARLRWVGVPERRPELPRARGSTAGSWGGAEDGHSAWVGGVQGGQVLSGGGAALRMARVQGGGDERGVRGGEAAAGAGDVPSRAHRAARGSSGEGGTLVKTVAQRGDTTKALPVRLAVWVGAGVRAGVASSVSAWYGVADTIARMRRRRSRTTVPCDSEGADEGGGRCGTADVRVAASLRGRARMPVALCVWVLTWEAEGRCINGRTTLAEEGHGTGDEEQPLRALRTRVVVQMVVEAAREWGCTRWSSWAGNIGRCARRWCRTSRLWSAPRTLRINVGSARVEEGQRLLRVVSWVRGGEMLLTLEGMDVVGRPGQCTARGVVVGAGRIEQAVSGFAVTGRAGAEGRRGRAAVLVVAVHVVHDAPARLERATGATEGCERAGRLGTMLVYTPEGRNGESREDEEKRRMKKGRKRTRKRKEREEKRTDIPLASVEFEGTARVLEDQVVGQERLHDVQVTLRWKPMGTSASGALGLGGEKKAGEISRRRGGLKRGDAPWILPISLDPFSIQLRAKYVRLQEGRDRWVSGCLYMGEKED
ncbi:hypothetical protein B0H13DRAFT_1935300 [Mycena leptocephala]|nr:hypothetical protein B0H13DRAFT_1935300 [Mycena leptocephala]